MWKIYLKSDEGVAVQSTLRGLRDCFDRGPDFLVSIGEIQYIDYEKDPIMDLSNAFAPFLYKRVSFEYEKEIRAVAIKQSRYEDGKYYWDTREIEQPGIRVPVDLNCLIERIYVSPTGQPWFTKLVASVCQRYKIPKEVVQSPLDQGPLY